MNALQELLNWTLAHRKNVIGEDKYFEGRISAIQDCIELLDEFEREVVRKTLDEVNGISEKIVDQYYAEDQMGIFRDTLKEMV